MLPHGWRYTCVHTHLNGDKYDVIELHNIFRPVVVDPAENEGAAVDPDNRVLLLLFVLKHSGSHLNLAGFLMSRVYTQISPISMGHF